MGIALKRGRVFTPADAEGQPGVVVVSESLARRAWPGQDALGKRLKIPLPGTPYHDTWLDVVGVVADARYREIQATRFDLYMSFLQVEPPPEPSRGALEHRARVARARDPGDRARPGPRSARDRGATMPSIVSEALGGSASRPGSSARSRWWPFSSRPWASTGSWPTP